MEAVQIPIQRSESVEQMVEWLLGPPLRNIRSGERRFGSFNHSIDPSSGQAGGQYTEITGYGVSLLTLLYRWRGEERFLDAAREAARFLMQIQARDGGYPSYPDPEDPRSEGALYTFDTAMCTTGLLDLYETDPDDAFLESARRAGDWLLSMQRDDGSFAAVYHHKNGAANPGNFFGDGSCIHVKNAIALIKLADATGERKYREAAERVCSYGLQLQSEEGFFWAMPSKSFVFTHAHCYTCEGLLATAAYTGNERFREAAMKGIRWLEDVQNEDGSVYQVYHDRRHWKLRLRNAVHAYRAADATSQAARLFALAGAKYAANYQRSLLFTTSTMQSEQGGLFYTHGRFRTNQTLYAWPTMFAIQAMEFGRIPASAKELF